jgi:hypothetical protein
MQQEVAKRREGEAGEDDELATVHVVSSRQRTAWS